MIIIPTDLLFIIPQATDPTINMGPELEQNESAFCAFPALIILSLYRSDMSLLPTGYPVIMLIKNT